MTALGGAHDSAVDTLAGEESGRNGPAETRKSGPDLVLGSILGSLNDVPDPGLGTWAERIDGSEVPDRYTFRRSTSFRLPVR